ncbi:hypothetical protein Y032_0222g2636 [Ancylostoma ceylanicum]|uniref:DNA2/NAM7 helicase-like C-terminal domain-containing protein n=1 Tax=Ancylostoma ceylanicum TaxID=53326 RepID=A0A016SHT4_9BILA|nr:hypothetical protein Y032_0222g2636 [Ancylostoma ceylanicum]
MKWRPRSGLTIATELIGRDIPADQICIISFYKEQFRRLAEPLRNLGIELSTVDTVQRREKDVVILLTTKTGFDPEGAEFLDDQRPMNVALTRPSHGQFVLGHVESLRQGPRLVVAVWCPACSLLLLLLETWGGGRGVRVQSGESPPGAETQSRRRRCEFPLPGFCCPCVCVCACASELSAPASERKTLTLCDDQPASCGAELKHGECLIPSIALDFVELRLLWKYKRSLELP